MTTLEVVELPVEAQSCRLCGARRKRGERDDEWVMDSQREYGRHELRLVGRGLDERWQASERPWSRRHVSCGPQAWHLVLAITGVELDEPEALAVLRQHGRSVTAADRHEVVGRPWAFLTGREVRELTALAESAAAPPEPETDPTGRCGLCGRSRSASWLHGALSWHDGTPAPLCEVCAELAPMDRDHDLLKVRAVGLLAAARPVPSMRAHDYYGMRMAAEVLQGDERHADGAGAWDYRPAALARVREAVALSLPEYLLDPAARAAGVEALLARRARAAAQAARQEAAARPGGDVDWS